MKQTAKVIRPARPGYAEVIVRRASACASAHKCGSCDHCSMMENAPEIVVVAENGPGAEPGDTVTVESATSSILGAAVILYIVPFVLFFLGYFLGGVLGWAEGSSIALGGAGFALGLLCALVLDRYRKHHNSVAFKIVSIED